MADVIDRDPNTPEVPHEGQGETVTMPKSEAESLRRELRESRESERYWAAAARGNGARPEAQPEVDDGPDPSEFIDEELPAAGAEEDTPAKFVDDLAAKGVEAITKRGLVTRQEARRIATEAAITVSRQLIGRERQAMTTDHVLSTEFPELKDQNSELFKETSVRYQKAVAMDPSAMKSPAALYLAAQAAKEALKSRAPRRGADDDYDGEERESDRRQRASSQDGRPRSRPESSDSGDYLGVEAQSIIKSFGVSEAEFKEQQKALAGSRPRGRR